MYNSETPEKGVNLYFYIMLFFLKKKRDLIMNDLGNTLTITRI